MYSKNRTRFAIFTTLLLISLLLVFGANAALAGPVLSIPTDLSANPFSDVTIPVYFSSNGNQITALAFSIDYDETWLVFDENVPNAINFSLPTGFVGDCRYDFDDLDGELDCTVSYFGSNPYPIPDGEFLFVKLQTLNPIEQTLVSVGFSEYPHVSFGDINGTSVPGSVQDGFVLIYESTRFLDLPIDYEDFVDATGLKDIDTNGLILTRVDHDRSNSSYLPFTGGDTHPAYTAASCPRVSCYNDADAIDISKPKGANVYASYSGKVVSVRKNCVEGDVECGDRFGNYILIDHGNCYRTRYSHLDIVDSDILTGTIVDARQIIGTIGKTGFSYGPHLDFQVRHDPDCDDNWTGQGDIVDPYGWNPTEDKNQIDPLTTNTGYLWIHNRDKQNYIDSSGGIAEGPNDDFQVNIAPGSVNEIVTITVSAATLPSLPAPGRWPVLTTYWFRVLEWLDGTNQSQFLDQFNNPVEIQMNYVDEALDHMDESSISIYTWDETTKDWLGLPSTNDTISNTVIAETIVPGIFNLQAQVLCGDTTEPNDNWSSATQITPDGIVTGTFDITTDEDWYVLKLAAGESFSVFLSHSNSIGSALLELYENGDDFVNSSESNLVISASDEQEAIYLIRVLPQLGIPTGCDTSYTLIFADNYIYLPITSR